MIEVLKPGFHSQIQDMGRFGYQEFGMPISGVMDVDSYRLANWLVGNSLKTEVLEITMTGPTLKFYKEAFIGITGADISPKIDGLKIVLNKTIQVSKGSVLSFGKLRNCSRCYLSISGGFGVQEEMGSKSTYSYAEVGGHHGKELKKADFLKFESSKHVELRAIPNEFLLKQYSVMPVRVTEGPEFDWFGDNEVDLFFRKEFVVSSSSNRMGYRLDGSELDVPDEEMISSGIVHGTIQVPSNGKPIILLAESQTTGGYPRIANVIKSDLPILGQQKPGDRIRFRKVSLEEAQANFSNKEKQYQELLNS